MSTLNRDAFRKASNYRLALATEVLAPGLAAARRLLAGSPTPPATWRRVLLLGADHIGDVLYRTVGLAGLKEWLPECEFLFGASSPAVDVLAGNPHVTALRMERSAEQRSLRELVRAIRAARPDAVICYDSGMSARMVAAVALARVPNCVGYVDKGFSGLVTHPVPIRRAQPFVAYFRDMVEFLTGKEIPSLRPQVFLPDSARQRARNLRESFGAQPMVVASVTSRQVSHRAIQRHMMEVLADLKRRAQVSVVILGAAEDAKPAQGLAEEAGLECFFATGTLSVLEAIALFELADVAFCLDSGPRHMANASGVPVVFCRNLEFPKAEAGCYLESETDVAPNVELVSYGGQEAPPLFSAASALSALIKHLPA